MSQVETDFAEKTTMGIYLLSFISVTLFCLSARGFISSLTREPFDISTYEYSARALRIERTYKTWAWGVLTLFLFYSFVVSFWQSFSEVLVTLS